MATLKACFTESAYGGHAHASNRGRACRIDAGLSGAEMFSVGMLTGFVTQGGGFHQVTALVDQWVQEAETDVNDINMKIACNDQQIERLSEGLGSLVDADLAAEAAKLKALQLQQQLSEQKLAIGNGTPSMLVALFK
jgi:flagellin